MKKSDFVQLAVIAVVAGFCISGQSPRRDNPEIAMTKCSKSDSSDRQKMNSNSMENGMGEEDMGNPPEDNTSQNKSIQRKSAARRAVEGDTSASGVVQKSAAQLAIESEYE